MPALSLHHQVALLVPTERWIRDARAAKTPALEVWPHSGMDDKAAVSTYKGQVIKVKNMQTKCIHFSVTIASHLVLATLLHT